MENSTIIHECEKALMGNEEYMHIQQMCSEAYKKGDIELYSDLVCKLQSIAEVICYRKGSNNNCTQICTRFL